MPAPKRRGARGRPRVRRGRRKKQKRAEVVAISDDDDEAPCGATRGGEIGGEGEGGREGYPGRGRTDQPSRVSGRDGGGGGGGGGGSGEEAKKPRRKTVGGKRGRRRRRRSLSSTATTAMRTRRWKRMTIAILRCERYRSDQCRRPSRAAEGWVVFLLAVVSNRTAPPRASRRQRETSPGPLFCARSASSPPVLFLADRIGACGSAQGSLRRCAASAVSDARDPSERRPRDRWPPCPPLPWRSARRARARFRPIPSPDPRESVVPSRHRAIRPRGSRGGVRQARRSRFHPDQLDPQGRAGGSHGRRHGHPPLLRLRRK